MSSLRATPPPPLAPCDRCLDRPHGEAGHADLRYHLSGPYPGHHIFVCAACGDRWIRHYGNVSERNAWTRYAEQFPTVAGQRAAVRTRGADFPF